MLYTYFGIIDRLLQTSLRFMTMKHDYLSTQIQFNKIILLIMKYKSHSLQFWDDNLRWKVFADSLAKFWIWLVSKSPSDFFLTTLWAAVSDNIGARSSHNLVVSTNQIISMTCLCQVWTNQWKQNCLEYEG